MARKQKAGNKRRLRVKKQKLISSAWLQIGWRYGLVISLAIGACWLGWQGLQWCQNIILVSLQTNSPVSEIRFSQSTLEILDQGERVDIENWISDFIVKNGPVSARLLAEVIQRKFDPKDVRVFIQSSGVINLHITPRVAMAKIRTGGSQMLVDQAGAIFNRIVSKQSLNQLPTLVDYDLDASDDEKRIKEGSPTMASALQLIKALHHAGLAQITQSRRVLHRGHEVTLRDPKMVVIFDHENFQRQVNRLKEVIYQTNRKGKSISRIELDYHGKVFVKYRF